MKHKLVLFAGCIMMAASAIGAATSESSATTLKSEQKVTLSPDGEGQYVAYFKATLQRSRGYTVFTTDLPTNTTVQLTVYPKDPSSDKKEEPTADFTEIDEVGGNIRQVMYPDDWYVDDEEKSESDPKKWVYYFEFTGDSAETFTVKFQGGVSIPQGREDNPLNVTPGSKYTNVSKELEIDGGYFIKARLTAGVLYEFATVSGNEELPLTIDFAPEEKESESESEDEEEDSPDYTLYDNPAYAEDPYNEGFFVIPNTTASYTISVMGVTTDSNNVEGVAFTFSHKKYDQVAVDKHKLAGRLSPGESATCVAGFLSDWSGRDAYDEIIDESLFAFQGVKGERYVTEASGAASGLMMRVYDGKGKILSENTSIDGESSDVRCAFEAAANGTYYVGVCEDLDDIFAETPSYQSVTLSLEKVSPQDGDPDEWDASDDTVAGATALDVLPGVATSDPFSDGAVNGPHRLSKTDWCDTFSIAVRKDVTYSLGFEFADPSDTVALPLAVSVFTKSGSSEKEVASGEFIPGPSATLSFTAAANATYYMRVVCSDTLGLDVPGYNVRAVAHTASGGSLGILKVVPHGTALGTFSIGKETVKYPCGSSILLSGKQTVKFQNVAGFKAVPAQTVEITPGTSETAIDVYYYDASDPKDDVEKGAVAFAVKNTETTLLRTLWEDDPEDNFAITGADGIYYDFTLSGVEGDAVFSIANADSGVVCEDVRSVSQIRLPKSKSKYILKVAHADPASPAGGGYTISGLSASVGVIKMAKTAVSVKENAPSVSVAVNRTSKDGYVRVRYGTVAGTAVPGEDYIAQNGVLEWENGDSKPKTVVVQLIPDLVEHYEGNKTFQVVLEPVDWEEDAKRGGEYPATITDGACTVTLAEVSKPGATVESAYAAKAPKAATVKTETVPIESGTFYGVLDEEGGALTNRLPGKAAVTFTASAANPAALSAKVQIAGKTYSFSAKGWDEDETEGEKTKTFELAQKVNELDEETGKTVSVVVTNTLKVTVPSGSTDAAGDWLKAVATAELSMNIPDQGNKGYQSDILYSGALCRNNAKVQDYLTAVTNFTGYYTVSLVAEGVTLDDGIPAGNGYLTVTVDGKGTAKVAGILADGATKISMSAAACAISPGEEPEGGYVMTIPLYYAKNPVLFGGRLKLCRESGSRCAYVSSCDYLQWSNDSAAATYDGEDGYDIGPVPVGGWFDTVKNLKRYYLESALEVSTAKTAEFPKEVLASGYSIAAGAETDGTGVSVSANAFSTPKRVLVKSGKAYDLETSVNPANVQVKLARATGLATGSFSLWSLSDDGLTMKELTGFKHYGVLITACDPYAPITDDTATLGFACRTVRLTSYDEAKKKDVARNWIFSVPFNINAVDQGEKDYWADDWGEEQ